MYINKIDSVIPPFIIRDIRQALEDSSILEMHFTSDLLASEALLNLIGECLSRELSIEIVFDDETILERTTIRLNQLGWGSGTFYDADIEQSFQNLNLLGNTTQLDTGSKENAHIIKLRFEYKEALHRITQLFSTIHKRVLSEKTTMDILARYSQIQKYLSPPHHLNIIPANGEIPLDEETFWRRFHLIKQGMSVEVKQDIIDRFECIHPVLFDMFSEPEASDHFFEELAKGIQILQELRLELSSWLQSYEEQLYSHIFGRWREIIGLWQKLQLQMELYEHRKPTSKKGLLKVFTRRTLDEDRHIEELYQLLLDKCHSFPVNGVFSLPPFIDVQQVLELRPVLSDMINRTTIKNEIRNFVVKRMRRLTLFNAEDKICSKEQLQSILEGFSNLMEGMNKRQIFKDVLEDNHMYLYQKMAFFDRLFNQWQSLLDTKSEFKAYYKFRQFYEQINEDELNLLKALECFPKEERLMRYELWYYRYLLNELLVEVETGGAQSVLDTLYNKHNLWKRTEMGIRWDRRISDIFQNIQALANQQKEVKHWLKTGDAFLLSNEVKSTLIDLFPIRLLSETSDFSSSATNCRVKVSRQGESDGNILLSFHTLSENKDATRKSVHYDCPPIRALEKGIVLSTHSDRWKSLNFLASYIRYYLPHGAIFENPDKNIIFSYISNHTIETLVLEQRGSDWTRYPIDTLSEAEIVERLLDEEAELSVMCMEGFLIAPKDDLDFIWDVLLYKMLEHTGWRMDVVQLSSFGDVRIKVGHSADMKLLDSVNK